MPNEKVQQEDWAQISRIVKARFTRITDEHISSMNENLDLLTESLQNAYGFTKEKADNELKKIKATIYNATKAAKTGVPEKIVYPRGHQQM